MSTAPGPVRIQPVDANNAPEYPYGQRNAAGELPGLPVTGPAPTAGSGSSRTPNPTTTQRTPQQQVVADTAQRATESVREGAGNVLDAGREGVQTVANTARRGATDLGDSIKKDGFFKGIWNYFSGLGSDTANGLGGGLSKFFSGTNHGGWIGGLLGVGGAWLASTMMGGGPIGTVLMMALIPAGFMLGRQMGNEHINPMLSNMFSGNRQSGERRRETPARERSAAAQPEQAGGAANPLSSLLAQQPTSATPAAPAVDVSVFQTPAMLAFATSGVSYSPSGALARTTESADQGLAGPITQATLAARDAGVTQAPANAANSNLPRAQTPAEIYGPNYFS